jgi:hypothetical protein
MGRVPPAQRLGRLPNWRRAAWSVPPKIEMYGTEPQPYLVSYNDATLAREHAAPSPVEVLRGNALSHDWHRCVGLVCTVYGYRCGQSAARRLVGSAALLFAPAEQWSCAVQA